MLGHPIVEAGVVALKCEGRFVWRRSNVLCGPFEEVQAMASMRSM